MAAKSKSPPDSEAVRPSAAESAFSAPFCPGAVPLREEILDRWLAERERRIALERQLGDIAKEAAAAREKAVRAAVEATRREISFAGTVARIAEQAQRRWHAALERMSWRWRPRSLKDCLRMVTTRTGRRHLSWMIGRRFSHAEGQVLADMLKTPDRNWEKFAEQIRRDPAAWAKYMGE